MRRYSRQPEMCADKVRYRSNAAAVRSKRKAGRKEKLHPYMCPFCKHWHMGHSMHFSGAERAISNVSRIERKRWLETIRIKERSEGI